MASKDQQLADELVTRSIDLLRFTASERTQVFEILKRMEEDLIDLLVFGGRALTDAKRAEKAQLLRQAQSVIEDYYEQVSGRQDTSLTGLARAEASFTAGALGDVMHGAIAVQLPPETYFKKLLDTTLIQKAPSAEWWSRQAGDTAFRFRNELAYGLSQSETNAQLITRIRGRATSFTVVDGVRVYEYTGGVMQVSRNNAAALVQTSVQTVAAEARRATYAENDDILKGIRQISTLDGHTTPVCVAYSGAAWKLDAARTPIAPNTLPYKGGVPRHWNCRSIEIPITKSFRELGLDIDEPDESTRSSSDGQIAAGMTMQEFLKRQEKRGPKFVDELLGEGRAQLWRDGKITLQQLVDQNGRPLTLEELLRKYAK
jgi:hypothetical protein